MSPSQLTQLHRRRQLVIRRATVEAIAKLWPMLAFDDLDGTYPDLLSAVGALVVRNRRTSGGLAAAYLRAFRASQGLTGDLRVVIPPLVAEQVDAALHTTSVAAVKSSTSRGVDVAEASSAALSQAAGAMSRLTLNGGRETITHSLAEDPRARGWVRVLGGSGCPFCQMLAGREYPASTVDFACHDRCGCSMEPAY